MGAARIVATGSVIVLGGALTAGAIFLGFMFGGLLGAAAAGGVVCSLTVSAGVAVNEFFASGERAALITINQSTITRLEQNIAHNAALTQQLQQVRATAQTALDTNTAIRAQREQERTARERSETLRSAESSSLVKAQAKASSLEHTVAVVRTEVGSLKEKVEEDLNSKQDTIADLTRIDTLLIFETDVQQSFNPS